MSTTSQSTVQTQSITPEAQENGQQNLVFTLQNHVIRDTGVIVNAKMLYLGKKNFILLKGSQVADEITAEDELTRKQVERKRIKNQNKISPSGEIGVSVITEDIPFEYASQAINFVTGTRSSGPACWSSEGKSLKKYLEDQ